MGEMAVPADALYGASTQRAVLNFPISGQRCRRALHPRAGAHQAGRRRDERASSACSTPSVAAADRRRGRRGRRRRRTTTHFPIDIYQTGSGTSTNMNANEVIAHLAAARLGAAGRSTPTTTSTLPVLERRHPDGAPAGGGDRDRGGRCCPALEPARTRAGGQGREFWPVVKTGRTHLQDATPIRLGQEFPGYAGQVEDVAPAGAGGAGRAARGAARRHRGRDRDQRPPRVRGPDVRPALRADRAGRARDRQPLPRPGHARRAIAAHGAVRTIALEPLEDRLGHPADGHGPAGRPRRARPARDPAGLEHHARQGEPGDRREPDDGRRPGRRQRRDDRPSARPAASSSST